MSLFELLVVFVVAFLVLKPEDVPHIAKKIKEFYNFFTTTKAEITSYLDLSQKSSIKVDEDIDQINFYLEKIANLGGKYEGEYSLTKIRDYYQKWQRHQRRLNNRLVLERQCLSFYQTHINAGNYLHWLLPIWHPFLN